MWSAVLTLALVTVPDPPRLLATFLVLSRPRTGRNLLAYYVGCLILNVFILLVPLTLLHFIPTLGAFVQDLLPAPATNGDAGIQPIPLAIGVVSLLVAARMAMRLRGRKRATSPAPGDGSAAEPTKPNVITRLMGTEDGTSGGGSTIQRLLQRIYKAWQDGSPWISLLMGLTYSPIQTTAALVIIVASGASFGAQLAAAISFVAIMLAILEVILIGYLIAPAKTEAVLRPVHDWTQAHILQMFVAIFAVGGALLTATGLGVI